MEGTPKFLYLGSDGKLGIDATNPKWIDSGRATPCEWGIYPIDTFDLNELGIVMVTV